eukprot:gene24815-10464_t
MPISEIVLRTLLHGSSEPEGDYASHDDEEDCGDEDSNPGYLGPSISPTSERNRKGNKEGWRTADPTQPEYSTTANPPITSVQTHFTNNPNTQNPNLFTHAEVKQQKTLSRRLS